MGGRLQWFASIASYLQTFYSRAYFCIYGRTIYNSNKISLVHKNLRRWKTNSNEIKDSIQKVKKSLVRTRLLIHNTIIIWWVGPINI
jgi:hypothetical protein